MTTTSRRAVRIFSACVAPQESPRERRLCTSRGWVRMRLPAPGCAHQARCAPVRRLQMPKACLERRKHRQTSSSFRTCGSTFYSEPHNYSNPAKYCSAQDRLHPWCPRPTALLVTSIGSGTEMCASGALRLRIALPELIQSKSWRLMGWKETYGTEGRLLASHMEMTHRT